MFILSHVQGRMFSSKDPVAHLIGDFFLAFLFCWPRSLARELQVNRFWNQCSRSLFVCRTSHQKNDYKKTSMKRKWASSKPTHHNTSHFNLLLKKSFDAITNKANKKTEVFACADSRTGKPLMEITTLTTSHISFYTCSDNIRSFPMDDYSTLISWQSMLCLSMQKTRPNNTTRRRPPTGSRLMIINHGWSGILNIKQSVVALRFTRYTL